ncbi:MAG: prepilin-type N-terminal cleavage/methylation domain-containing protein [Patescibacteria group bacterium]|nr:prepilin-type N-terminal cleavage/methylation domain-containing protein [Patescibacteria group bacterium]
MQRKKGFTLIEMIVAIFLITAGIGAAYLLIQKTSISTSRSLDRLTAAYLSQEGIEIVRNIRDSNWLAGIGPYNGLDTGNYEADYENSALDNYTGNPLKFDEVKGFYNYDSGDTTKFTRKIILTNHLSSDHYIDVLVEVSWMDRGKSFSIDAETYLYDWLPL